MTVRERQLLYVLLGVGGLVGAVVLGHSMFWSPLQDHNRSIAQLETEVQDKRDAVLQIEVDKKRLEKLRARSLPASPDQAAAEYAKWLHPELLRGGLRDIDLQGPPAAALKPPPAAQQGKKAGHMVLTYNVRARGDMPSVVKTLDALKKAPLLHRIKGLTLAPADSERGGGGAGRLNVQLTIEAMIASKAPPAQPWLSGPDQRVVAFEAVAGLRRAPIGMGQALYDAVRIALKQQALKEQLARNYSDIARQNPFIGAVPLEVVEDVEDDVDARQFTRLVHTNPGAKEAYLRNLVFKQPELRLKAISGSGYDVFRIFNENREKVLVKGKVLRVEQRDVYFQVADYIYGIHIGQSLADALRRPLSEDQLDDLELTVDEEFASAEAPPARKGTKGGPPTKGGPNTKGGKKGPFQFGPRK